MANQSALATEEIKIILSPLSLKRTGEKENCWYDFPRPKPLYHERDGSIIYEGDELVDMAFGQNFVNQFQICQVKECQHAFTLEKDTCPKCGFNFKEFLEEQAQMERIRKMQMQSMETHNRFMNILQWSIINGDKNISFE